MTPEQCRMARAGLSIGARELAEAARVSVSTITRFEAGQVVHEMTLALIQTALERNGIGLLPMRRWVNHLGPKIAADPRKRRPKPHTIWHLESYGGFSVTA
jgi:transcriptional regulator with XRE-family HTH domain